MGTPTTASEELVDRLLCEAEALAIDQAIYGTAFIKLDDDGIPSRVDPVKMGYPEPPPPKFTPIASSATMPYMRRS